jgi:hypothetical protein
MFATRGLVAVNSAETTSSMQAAIGELAGYSGRAIIPRKTVHAARAAVMSPADYCTQMMMKLTKSIKKSDK